MTIRPQTQLDQPPSAEHSRDYRSFATLQEQSPWLVRVEDQVGSWLRGRKNFDVDLSVDRTTPDPANARTLSVRRHRSGKDRALRIVLEEDNAAGHWTTEVTAVEHERGGGWLSVDVASANGQFVAVPNVARYLLQALHLQDGDMELTCGPRVMGVDRVEEVVALLESAERRGAVFIAGTDGQLEFEPFRAHVAEWAKQTDGLAHVVVLDPAATAELSDRIGANWATPPWTVRTYLPDLDWTESARQHRILSTQRLAQDSDRYLCNLLGGFARSVVLRRPTPSQLQAWRRTFDRLDNSAITEAMTASAPSPTPTSTPAPAPTPAPSEREPLTHREVDESQVDAEATLYLAELERVREALGLPDLTDETLQRLAEQATAPRVDPTVLADAARRIQRQQSRIEELEAAVSALQGELLEEQVEHLTTREDLERATDRSAWLGQQLAAAGEHDAAYGPVPDEAVTTYPGSYGELLERAGELADHGVVITADHGTVRDLDGVDASGKTLRNAWDALLVLADYVKAQKAGDFTGNVHQFLSNTPTGYRSMSPGKHAWNETGTTMNQYGDERVLPVPTDVNPSGYAEMRPHFKLGRIGMASPRMHYLDDTGGTGNVYIGYIGTHLTNTKTN